MAITQRLNKPHRSECHQINIAHPYYKTIDELCYKSKNLYNYTNYIIRQEFINNGIWLRYNYLAHFLKSHEPYKALPIQSSQQIIKMLDKNWASFFKNIKDFKNNPEKYQGNRPKIPHYKGKNGRFIIVMNQRFKLKDDFIIFPRRYNGLTIKTNVSKVKYVRIIPMGKCYKMEVNYDVVIPKLKDDNGKYASIDLGINNFATITNNIGLKPIVINGKIIKSINQYYNKMLSSKQSSLKKLNDKHWSNELDRFTLKRHNKINDYMHKASRFVIDYCIKNKINTLIIGYNMNWKDKVNLGKKNNQSFIFIPFTSFIKQLDYKCQDAGIKLIITEESYTSKASFLDKDEIPTSYNNKINPVFSGKRIKRGLYLSKYGILINSDVNGSYNIMRNVFPNVFKTNEIVGVGLHPTRTNILVKNNRKTILTLAMA